MKKYTMAYGRVKKRELAPDEHDSDVEEIYAEDGTDAFRQLKKILKVQGFIIEWVSVIEIEEEALVYGRKS